MRRWWPARMECDGQRSNHSSRRASTQNCWSARITLLRILLHCERNWSVRWRTSTVLSGASSRDRTHCTLSRVCWEYGYGGANNISALDGAKIAPVERFRIGRQHEDIIRSEAPASTPARQGAPGAIVRLRIRDRSRSKDDEKSEATYDIPDAGDN